jgi:hypothetical protein
VCDPDRDLHDSKWTVRGVLSISRQGFRWGQKNQGALHDLSDRRIARVYTEQFNSSRGMKMCYGLEGRGSTPGRGMRFFSTGSGFYPASYRGYSCRSVKLRTHLHLVPTSIMVELNSTLLFVFMGWYLIRDNFIFTLALHKAKCSGKTRI